MSKKLNLLIASLIGAVSAAAIAIVTYIGPEYGVAINAAIGIGNTAIIEILNLFVKKDSK